MEHWKKKNSFSYKDLLYKALIFVGTVAFIVYFLPRDGKFNYQFDINKPWKYGQLMATFDFPIYKDEAVVKREQDSLLASFQPYFELDKEVEKSALAKLKENYHAHLKGILPSTDYIRYIERGLKAIYQSGVVSTEEMRTLLHDSISSVMVIEDKLANQRTTDGIYTVKRAYENLISGDTAHYNRDILRQCALNEYITPNLIYDSVRTETARKELLDNYSWANGVVQSGQKIIDRGEIVNKQTYNILESLRKESIKRSESIGQKRLILGGQILFVGILILCFMLYLELFRKDYYERKGSLSLLFALIVFYCVITALMVTNNIFNVRKPGAVGVEPLRCLGVVQGHLGRGHPAAVLILCGAPQCREQDAHHDQRQPQAPEAQHSLFEDLLDLCHHVSGPPFKFVHLSTSSHPPEPAPADCIRGGSGWSRPGRSPR